jgi:hypothetical protein
MRFPRLAVIPAVLVVVLALGLAGCYPGGPESLGELSTVITVKNPDADFTGLRNYAMIDKVFEIDAGDDSEPLDPRYEDTILEEIQAQMEAAGFARVDTSATQDIDVYLQVGAVVREVWVYWYDWGYYPGYPGYPGYYPPTVGVASFEQGSIVWQFSDVRELQDPGNEDAKAILNWVGGINGAVANTTSTNEAGIRNGIRQAFAQSPYIVADNGR